MDNQIKSIIYIVLGAIIIFSAAGIVFQLLFALFGFYLLFQGLRLRNPHSATFRFFRFNGWNNGPF